MALNNVNSLNNNLGVGSGLPLEPTLAKLREAENVALALVQSRYDRANQRLSAYGTLKGALEAFQNAAKDLANPQRLGAMKSSSNIDGVNVSASGKAIAGSYQIDVQQLARAQTLVAAGQADRATAIGTGGVITFTLQDGSTRTLDLSGQVTSLDALVQAINADESLQLGATLVNDGSDAPHRLLLTTKATGTSAAITRISVADNDALNEVIGFGLTDPAHPDDPAATINHMQVRQAAQDAKLSINGIVVTSASNDVQNAIEGVSVSLIKTGAGTVTVASDTEAASKTITAFVTAYNALQSTIKALTAYDTDTKMGSALTGDALARRVQSQMRASLDAMTDGKLGSLSRMGITTDPTTGALNTDASKLNAALKENLADVLALFTGQTGIAQRVARASDDFLRGDGMFAASDTSIQKTLKSLQREYESTERRIDDKIDAYRAQFVALDRTVAQMSSISSYLTTQLSMLNNLAAGNK